MKYADLREFIGQLEEQGEMKRISREADPYLEITEICDRTLRMGGPALLFQCPKGSAIPLLGNLFGTPRRVALGMGEESVTALRGVGQLLATLKEPEPPRGMKDAWESSASSARPWTWRLGRSKGRPVRKWCWRGPMSTWAGCPSKLAGREMLGP